MLLAPSYNCPFAHNDLDGGSITLSVVYTVDTVDIVYTIQAALHCSNSSMFAYVFCGKVRTLLEWAAELLSKKLDWVMGEWIPLRLL